MHFPHFCIPFMMRFSLVFTAATLAFTRVSLMFFCLLNATKGGCGKTIFRCVSWDTTDLQCLLVMCGIDGSVGLKQATKVGLLLVSCLKTHLSASSLGIALALAMVFFSKNVY